MEDATIWTGIATVSVMLKALGALRRAGFVLHHRVAASRVWAGGQASALIDELPPLVHWSGAGGWKSMGGGQATALGSIRKTMYDFLANWMTVALSLLPALHR